MSGMVLSRMANTSRHPPVQLSGNPPQTCGALAQVQGADGERSIVAMSVSCACVPDIS